MLQQEVDNLKTAYTEIKFQIFVNTVERNGSITQSQNEIDKELLPKFFHRMAHGVPYLQFRTLLQLFGNKLLFCFQHHFF